MATAITIEKIQKIIKEEGKDALEIASTAIKPEGVTLVDTALSFVLKAANSEFKTGEEVIVTYTAADSTTPIIKQGKYTIDKTTNTNISITDLKNVSNFTLNFTGQIGIADDAVMLSVRFGNMNKNKDWIIDFSDKTSGAPGTKIKLTQLIEWINKKNKEITDEQKKDNVPEVALIIPPGISPTDQVKIANYEIIFKEFHFNITKKTFRIEVSSGGEENQEITFGAFTIKKLGLILTNEEWVEEKALALTT